MKILIVDDALAIRRQMVRTLNDLGCCDLLEAGTVQEAWLLLVKTVGIQVVFSDWHMPGESGLDLLRKMRSAEDLKDIPFIMLTTEQEKDRIIQAARFGLQGYLFKPINKTLIQQRLASIGLWPEKNA